MIIYYLTSGFSEMYNIFNIEILHTTYDQNKKAVRQGRKATGLYR
jgi:hypothetical protein